MSNGGHRGRCFLWWKMQMVRDLCRFSCYCGPEFSGVFIFFGISWCLFCALTKEKPRAKNVSLIFYESAADFPSGFSCDKMVLFCNTCQNISLPEALSVWIFQLFVQSCCVSEAWNVRTQETQIANTPLYITHDMLCHSHKRDNFTIH